MIVLDADLLRPSTLAALAAILSQEANEAEDLAEAGIGTHATVDHVAIAATAAADALIANVGKGKATEMLMDAGAMPDYLDR